MAKKSGESEASRARATSALGLVLALAAGGAAAKPVLAHDQPPPRTDSAAADIQLAEAKTLDGVVIQGQAPIAIDRLPQPIKDQPQAITVIDAAKLQDQAVSTLDQAVRNVPGITANTGEGGGATAGDQFRIRGFDAQNDLSVDGLRDFGAYTRDSFDVESVQVFLGPSGANFGRGSFGGQINTSSKMAHLGNAGTAEITGGSADLGRVTLDVNHEFGDHAAGRLNLMGHTGGFADIDTAKSDRWGAAGAFALGLGTNTNFEFNYFHQTDRRIPYYGVPVSGPTPTSIAVPLPVPRNTFYGANLDHDKTQADVVTAKFTHKPTDWLAIHNDSHVGTFARDFFSVAPACSTSTTAPNQNAPGSCASNFFDNNPATVPLVVRGGASGPYYLDQWGAQNLTTALADFHIGALKSQAVAGLDFAYEYAERRNTNAYKPNASFVFPRPAANAFAPNPVWGNAAFITTNTRTSNDSDTAVFGSEQLWLTDDLSLLGGVRLERYKIKSDLATYGTVDAVTGAFTITNPNTIASTEVNNNLVSPRFSVIYQPNPSSIFYASWARSSQPATGTSISNVGTPITANQTALEPTTSETYEIGGRVPLWTPAIKAGLSIFQTTRDNSKDTDPLTGGVVTSGDRQRVKGIEASLEGQLTDRWNVSASYTWLDTETLQASVACGVAPASPCGSFQTGTVLPNPFAIGQSIPFAANNAATLWTTYNVTPKVTLGGGARYTEKVWLNNTHTAQAPDYISLDALVAYEVTDSVRMQINGTNLADHDDNYDAVVVGRAAHAPGRAFSVALNKRF